MIRLASPLIGPNPIRRAANCFNLCRISTVKETARNVLNNNGSTYERKKKAKPKERFLRSLPVHYSETEAFDCDGFDLFRNTEVDCMVHNFTTGRPLGLMKISSRIFALLPRLDHLYAAKIYESSWLEDASYTTLEHGEIKTTGKKPYPQKGTGAPAAGSLFSAQRIGGYACHGVRPHDPTKKILPLVYDSAIRSVLSARYFEGALNFVDSIHVDHPNSNIIPHILNTFGCGDCRSAYFIYGGLEPELEFIESCDRFMTKSIKNNTKARVLVSSVREMILHPILMSRQIFVDKAAVEYIEYRYKDVSITAEYQRKMFGPKPGGDRSSADEESGRVKNDK